MSTKEVIIKEHLSAMNSISQQYCRLIKHFDSELSTAKARITSLEATLKDKMSEHTQHIDKLLDVQSTLLQRIEAIESRNDVSIEVNDDEKSQQTVSNTSDSELNPKSAPFHFHIASSPNSVTEQKQTSFPSKETRDESHMKREVVLSKQCMKLIHVVKQFNNTGCDDQMAANIQQILNDYLYVMDTHNDDHLFEAIAGALGACDASKCKIFDRNYRNLNTVNDALPQRKIMDKIHCYWQHCYDIGNKLSLKERMLCDNFGNSSENGFTNHKIQNIRQILQRKHKYPANMRMRYNTSYKYEQLSLFMKEKKTDENDESEGSDESSDMFHFGVQFEYVPESEKLGVGFRARPNVYEIVPKYKSLKEEMLNNTISTLGLHQFNQELYAAQIHYATDYRKQKYNKMALDQLLSSMIYCNYDTLQCLFSKTYRLSG
eukprot:354870_1